VSGAVIDASAALTLVLKQEGWARVQGRLEKWKLEKRPVHVAGHFWLEFGNALIRRQAWASDRVMASMHALDDFGLETVELSRPLVLLALDLADRHGLSMYDAAHLALAETVDGPLLTADRQLLVAAGARAIPVEGEDHRLSERQAAYPSGNPAWPRYAKASAYLARLRQEAMSAGRS
jgi:predicted nucleic acid-binding protein